MAIQLTLFAAGFFLALPAHSGGLVAPQSEAEYCAMAQDMSQFQQLATDSENLMAFQNSGGLINGGVCWWHSRLQRASLYLTIYRPELERDEKAIKKAIHALLRAERVVMIPGYRNWREFSGDWQDYIQKKLEQGQLVGGFIQQTWIDGILGRTHEDAEKLERRMDDLYAHVHDSQEIAYEKLQIPGIPAHSWLVANMTRTERGYELTVIDSNFLTPQKYTYRRGMTSFDYPYFGRFIPYLRRNGEMREIEKAMLRFCDPEFAKLFPEL